MIGIFLGRRRSFPLHFTAFVVALGVSTLGILLAMGILFSGSVDHDMFTSSIGVFGWFIWVAYVHKSRRVAATFVE
jgi:hypothetical protein